MATRVIKLYNQAQDARWYAGEVKPNLVGLGANKAADYEPTSTSKGVCFGLSIWWTIKKGKGEDFWAWLPGPGQHVADIKSLFLAQRGEYDFTRFDEADKKITTETPLKRQNEILMEEGTAFTHTGYYYISLRGKFGTGADASGHAIAAHIDPNGLCRYFDPNYGEYESDTLQELLVELSNRVRSYNVTDLKIYWCCWG